MAKLLVVDDEANIRTLIKKYAQYEGYEIIEAVNGIDAVAKCRAEDFDLIVMDVMMPELDGFSAVREIRKNKNIPVIMLSARGEEYDRIHGFEVGVDDYVVKPFSPRELMMRIAAVLRRSGKEGEDESDVVDYGDLAIDFRGRFVYVLGRRVEMSPKEYDLLFYLAKISFLYNSTRFFISCLLSFTIIFFPVVSVTTVSGVSSTSSIRSGFTNTLTPLIFVTSITLSSPSLLSEHFLHFIRFVHFSHFFL